MRTKSKIAIFLFTACLLINCLNVFASGIQKPVFKDPTIDSHEINITIPIKSTSTSTGVSTLAVSTQVVNIHLTCNGSQGRMISTATWDSGFSGVAKVSCNFDLEYADTRYGSYTTANNASKYLDSMSSFVQYSIVYTPTTTRFWRTHATVNVIFTNGSSSYGSQVTPSDLCNNKCVPYPAVYGVYWPYQKLPEPYAANMPAIPVTNRAPRMTYSQLCDYRYYISGIYTWNNIDVHHIIPIKFGGTNNYSNLIPISRSNHQTLVSPWWANYDTTGYPIFDGGCLDLTNQ